jgi:Predicted integral membrane protein
MEPLITNDAVVLGMLMFMLAFVFKTASSDHPFWKKFYTFVPSLLLCYFLPSLLNSFGIVSGSDSSLYFVASRYLLPASLILLTLSIDLKSIAKLGPKSVIMFLAGTTGVIIGGPLAILIVSAFNPDLVGGEGADAVWRGMTTIAGSWIGGGANQAAMLEVFGASPELFSIMVTVDIIVANIWMAVLLYGAGRSEVIDAKFKADASSITDVKTRIEKFQLSVMKMPKLPDTMLILGIALGFTGVSHYLADIIVPFVKSLPAEWELDRLSLDSGFFWIVVLATTFGLALSFTSARKLEGAGASRLGSAMLYVLVATIGMQMDLKSIYQNYQMFMIGSIWITIHIAVLLITARIIRAPFFFTAVGSMANIGGAASAPIIASAFHPSLAPVGVLLAVLGYAVGTYGAWVCGIIMQAVAP